METVEIRDVNPARGIGLQPSAEPRLCAFSRRYSNRGWVQSVLREAEQQKENEQATRELAPDAYRMSSLSDAAIGGCYRRGKQNMAVSDLVVYFQETRQRRIRGVDFSETAEDEMLPVASDEKNEKKSNSRLPMAVERISKAVFPKSLKESANEWFDTTEPDTSNVKKRFPLSAFAAIAAVAVSLMLIVASSVLLTRAESRMSQLNEEISTAYSVANDLQAELETRDNLLLIRQIATEEYGMVNEEFVRTQYITMETEDSIETYEEEKKEGAGLSALLSAIGIR